MKRTMPLKEACEIQDDFRRKSLVKIADEIQKALDPLRYIINGIHRENELATKFSLDIEFAWPYGEDNTIPVNAVDNITVHDVKDIS
jgi:hypothetical protein